jgi:aminotransferase
LGASLGRTGSSFYRNGGHDKLRFTFSKKDSTLDEACQRLSKLAP